MPQEKTTPNLTNTRWELVEEIRSDSREIFSIGQHEVVEEGEESEFSRKLLAFIDRFHAEAIDAIEETIEVMSIDPDLVAEALATVGDSEDTKSHASRLMILTKFMRSPVPRIRYGAAMGLAALKDPRAIPIVENALEVEDVKILRGILDQLRDYLNN